MINILLILKSIPLDGIHDFFLFFSFILLILIYILAIYKYLI